MGKGQNRDRLPRCFIRDSKNVHFVKILRNFIFIFKYFTLNQFNLQITCKLSDLANGQNVNPPTAMFYNVADTREISHFLVVQKLLLTI